MVFNHDFSAGGLEMGEQLQFDSHVTTSTFTTTRSKNWKILVATTEDGASHMNRGNEKTINKNSLD